MLDKFFKNIQKLKVSTPVYVGFSGGIDSTVLLYLLKKYFVSHTIIAIHCNHGISKFADSWQQHCSDVARELNVEIISVGLNLDENLSVELQARELRRECFVKYIPSGSSLFLAHHLNDQIETVLYRLIRGTGIDGAAGIKEHTQLKGINIYRPLLNLRKEELTTFAQEKKLKWIEDPSNQEQTIDRNYIRGTLLPSIIKRWPSAIENINRFATICNQTASEKASDIKKFLDNNFDFTGNILSISPCLLSSTENHQCEILRQIISYLGAKPLNYQQMLVVLKDVVLSGVDAMPIFINSEIVIRRYQNNLYFYLKIQYERAVIFPEYRKSLIINEECIISSSHSLVVSCSTGLGVDLILSHGNWGRTGKKVFQNLKIPPWQRGSFLLLHNKSSLIAILGLWVRPKTGFNIIYSPLN